VDKGERWRGWIQVWSIWYILRTFGNATIYHQHNNKNLKETATDNTYQMVVAMLQKMCFLN
jgi:hypothetical protein